MEGCKGLAEVMVPVTWFHTYRISALSRGSTSWGTHSIAAGLGQRTVMGSQCAAGTCVVQFHPALSVFAAAVHHISQSYFIQQQLEDITMSERDSCAMLVM